MKVCSTELVRYKLHYLPKTNTRYNFVDIDKDVELMVAVLEEVADWEGLAGQLNINTINIKHDCVAPALAQCYRREVVKAYCNRFDDDPYQVASDIADALDRQNNRRQAKAIRNLKFTRESFGKVKHSNMCFDDNKLKRISIVFP